MTEIQQNIHYVMAVIKVPMLRQLNGSFDSLSDHTTVSFEMIDDLPTKPDYKVDNNYIKLKLNEMFAEPPIALRKPSFTPSHIIKNDVILDDVDTRLEQEQEQEPEPEKEPEPEPEPEKEPEPEPEPEKEIEQEPEIDNSEEIAASKLRRFGENFLSQHKKKHSISSIILIMCLNKKKWNLLKTDLSYRIIQ